MTPSTGVAVSGHERFTMVMLRTRLLGEVEVGSFYLHYGETWRKAVGRISSCGAYLNRLPMRGKEP